MKPNKAVRLLIISAVMMVLPTMLSVAAEQNQKLPAPENSRKSVRLFAKNPANWNIVKGGNGTLIYHEVSGAFTFNAAGLQPRSPYALIRYADAPPRAEILARGTSDGHGRLETSGIWRNWTGKFWLVTGEDLAGNVGESGSMRAWRPERYLFEEKQLGVACQCPTVEK